MRSQETVKKRPSKAAGGAVKKATRDRVLEVAEQLFVSEGFSDASLRRMTQLAGASLGAVNYYFGSKEGLFAAVVERQFGPLLRQRMEGLRRLETSQQPLAWDHVLDLLASWLDPLLQDIGQNPGHASTIYAIDRFMTARSTAPSVFEAISPYWVYLMRLTRALQKALPDVSGGTVSWRFNFLIGAVTHALSNGDLIAVASEGLCDPSDLEAFRCELLTAGLILMGACPEEAARTIDRSVGRPRGELGPA